MDQCPEAVTAVGDGALLIPTGDGKQYNGLFFRPEFVPNTGLEEDEFAFPGLNRLAFAGDGGSASAYLGRGDTGRRVFAKRVSDLHRHHDERNTALASEVPAPTGIARGGYPGACPPAVRGRCGAKARGVDSRLVVLW